MDILKIYLICTNNKIKKLILLILLILLGTFIETVGIGLLIPLLSLFVSELGEIQLKISEIFLNYPLILEYLISLNKNELIIFCLVLILGVFTIKTAILIYLGFFSSDFIYDLQRKLAKTLFSSYIIQPYSFHLQKNSSELMRNVTSEVGVFVGRVLIPIIYLFTEIMVVVFLLSFLLYIEPIVTLSAALTFLIFILATNFLSKSFLSRWGEQRQSNTGLVIKTIQESFGAIKEIKLLNIENEFIKKFQVHNFFSTRAEGNMMAFQNIPRFGLEYLAIICFTGVIYSFVDNDKDINFLIPLLGIFAATVFRLLPSANRIIVNLNSFRYGYNVIKIIKKELTSYQTNSITSSIEKNNFNFNNINLENVKFQYGEERKVIFKDLSFKISRGDVIGIYGPSGSGKSTLIDIICGLLKQNEGSIKVNNRDIEQLKNNWQKVIGYVPQAPFFLDDTIKKNIGFTFAEDAIDDNKINNSIKDVELENFINELPLGINTFIGEKGVRVSGGQKQRIAIARALYRNCQFLILDEATSALDVKVEDKIINSLNKIKDNKTIILVSHRKTTLQICNKIFKLDSNGCIKICKYSDLG